MERLIQLLNNKNKPQEVKRTKESFAILEGCFDNVQEKISREGGSIVYGWKIHVSRIVFEAERHAIWKSPDGTLFDITPDSTTNITTLFVEEHNGWTYQGEFIDNIRINATGNPLVDDYILILETITKLLHTGKRNDKTTITLLEPVVNLIQSLTNGKKDMEQFIYLKNTKQDICFCGNNSSYENCHNFTQDAQDTIMEWVNKLKSGASLAI
jgi:hypothetical protein